MQEQIAFETDPPPAPLQLQVPALRVKRLSRRMHGHGSPGRSAFCSDGRARLADSDILTDATRSRALEGRARAASVIPPPEPHTMTCRRISKVTTTRRLAPIWSSHKMTNRESTSFWNSLEQTIYGWSVTKLEQLWKRYTSFVNI